MILYICGEYTCTGINPTRLFPLELAYELGALVVAVEHRFYGTSQPFDNLATEHLQYLNSRQALNDLAQFSDFFQDAINARFGQTGRNQWISIGGSYPGALSAWYRYKFPHKTAGSLASSGVVEAILNYTAFDEQVARSAGPECAEHLRAVTRGLEQGLPGVKASFGAAHLSDDDFLLLAGARVHAMLSPHMLTAAAQPTLRRRRCSTGTGSCCAARWLRAWGWARLAWWMRLPTSPPPSSLATWAPAPATMTATCWRIPRCAPSHLRTLAAAPPLTLHRWPRAVQPAAGRATVVVPGVHGAGVLPGGARAGQHSVAAREPAVLP